MTVSLQDLLVPQSAAQVRATMVSALTTLGIPAAQWTPGGALSLILTVTATVYAMFTTLMAQAIGSGFLPTASGGWLTLLAYYVYGVTRPAATFASGPLTLTNSGGGTFSYASGAVTFLNTTNGLTYSNLTPLALGPSSTQTIQVQCTAAGSSGSAAPGEISTLVTVMPGVTCSNPSAVVGQDAMSDANLRTLCLNKLGALSVRGPRSAYAYAIQVALNAVTGAPVNINRQAITRSSHNGTVSIVVASPEGAADPNDIAGIRTSIESGVPGLSPPFSGARPDCVTVNVSGAAPVVYDPTIIVWALASAGLQATEVAAEIAAGLSTWMSGYPISGVTTDQGTGLWATGVDAQVAESSAATVVSVEGAYDLDMALGQVATDGISVSVRLVSVS